MSVPARRPGRPAAAALWLFAAVLLQGCVSSSPRVERRDAPESAEQADPARRAQVRMELAAAYFGRGQGSTALDEIKQVLAAQPNHADAYNLRGLIQASMGDPQAAGESFRRALQLKPGDADTLHNYGWLLCQQRRFAEADAQFAQALAQPGYRDSQRTLLAQGVCYARNDQWPEAERTLARAYELDPGNPAVAVNLSEVLYRRGEYERARFYIRRVNAQDDLLSAQTLWLAARIENRLGQAAQVRVLGQQLRNRFPQAPETLSFERGRFDE
ncbi:MAG TPA: type IV pilus biogenesis/stability protein PilW [Ideonella sp.]|nr:type IV pilus biogenesis/stability protein PilW [Ideonella sp.]